MSHFAMANSRRIVVAVKLVATEVSVDPIRGKVHVDPRFLAISAADQAAFGLALALAPRLGATVEVVSVGPPECVEVLRDMIAAGASSATRIAIEADATHGESVAGDLAGQWDSASVAAVMAPIIAGADVVLCGDYSLDRGSGSVPAFLAHHLSSAQALGLVAVRIEGERVLAERRLDAGRREHLEIPLPAVLSVEPSVAVAPRSSLAASLATPASAVGFVRAIAPQGAEPGPPAGTRQRPYRPRPAFVRPPESDLPAWRRVVELTGALSDREAPTTIEVDPPEAAAAIVEQLRAWGYLE